MSDLGRVLVLSGGLSHERDVSLRSGRRVCEGLRGLGAEVEHGDADATMVPSIERDPPAVVFPALHGSAGEDGAMRHMLELLSVPYVGATPDACRVSFDKATAKTIVRSAGIVTPDSVALPKETFHDLGATAVLDRITAHLGLPLFVKPSQGGSCLGGSAVRRAEDLPAAMVGCFGYGEVALVERYVEGTEIAVSIVDLGEGPVALPAVEIVPEGEAYDYAARYTSGRTAFFSPARLSERSSAAATEMALRAHRTLGLRDLSRTDMIVSNDGVPRFLEVNVAPGMTETSTFPMAVEAGGLDFAAVCRDLSNVAVNRAA